MVALLELWLASAAVLLLTLGVVGASPRAAATRRHAISAAGLLAVLWLPAWAALLPSWSWGVLPPGTDSAGWSARAALVPASWLEVVSDPWLWVAVAWGVGALVGLAQVAAGVLRLAAARRRSLPVVDPGWQSTLEALTRRVGLARAPELVVDPRAKMPMTWGIARPVIALPATAGWPEGRRQAVLIHELAHVRRCDAMFALLAQIACALFWLQPLVWIVGRRLRVEQEIAADDLVLDSGARPSAYAGHLLEMVRRRCAPHTPLPAVAMAGASSHLARRLRSVLGSRVHRGAASAGRVRIAVAAALLAVPGAVVRLEPRSQPRSEPQVGQRFEQKFEQKFGQRVERCVEPRPGSAVAIPEVSPPVQPTAREDPSSLPAPADPRSVVPVPRGSASPPVPVRRPERAPVVRARTFGFAWGTSGGFSSSSAGSLRSSGSVLESETAGRAWSRSSAHGSTFVRTSVRTGRETSTRIHGETGPR